MNYIDLNGQPVSKPRIDRERDYFKTDKAKRTIPAMMTFAEYVAQYVGWTAAGPTGRGPGRAV